MRSIVFFVLFIIHISYFIFRASNPVLAVSRPITVSASIPKTRITIFGYTSPTSKVELSGFNISAFTRSDDTGYYIFNDYVIPRPSGELCLASFDHDQRRSNTVCIPPPPDTNYHTSIGPIIIPPTLTLDQENIKPDATIVASGQTIPNSMVKIYFYQRESAPSFPKSVRAFSLPALTLISNADGHYSFNLPTAYATDYRLFSSTLYQNQFDSPRSNTLAFSLPSLWYLIWQKYYFIIIMIPFFVVSLGFFLWLTLKYYFHQSPRNLPAVYIKTLILLGGTTCLPAGRTRPLHQTLPHYKF